MNEREILNSSRFCILLWKKGLSWKRQKPQNRRKLKITNFAILVEKNTKIYRNLGSQRLQRMQCKYFGKFGKVAEKCNIQTQINSEKIGCKQNRKKR